MTRKVSASRAALSRRRNDLSEAFASVSPEAAAFVSRNPALRAKLLRAAERLGEAFPGRPAYLRRYEDPESGEWDLFVEVQRGRDLQQDYASLRALETQWIHDREDPKLEFTFSFHFGR
jgi:hypothetical protein